jgi:2-keto-3-deoxy-6-phosphogluconate aldolase
MTKAEILTKMNECGVVAVIRANSPEEAEKLAEACSKGGIVGLELTFTVRAPRKSSPNSTKRKTPNTSPAPAPSWMPQPRVSPS